MHGVFLHRLTLQFPVVANYLFFFYFLEKSYTCTHRLSYYFSSSPCYIDVCGILYLNIVDVSPLGHEIAFASKPLV